MDRRGAAAGTVLFAATVPVTVAGLTPWWLAGRPAAPSATPLGARVVGATMIVGGSLLVGASFVRFVRARGTPAPIAETEALVAAGPYRFTRNPQYVGVLAVATGQACWWWSRPAGWYAVALAGVFHTFVRIYEEPRLRRRFPAEYDRFTSEVPRWLWRSGVTRARRPPQGSAGR
ncbi:MAG TPA: isoprenylcysteine carboxylmethyltransferase family protein [Egicoccus sp.]|nr:isoprenylcysteine carboxylmethyltransferase family protein [Egicoccus sp.]HSK22524.1 isoprenylcysteine carboxylmethyltransferase family protein [Egicoccus sp.]